MKGSSTVLFLPQATPEHVKFDSLFFNKNPIKLEVCSGHGDWIVDKAKKSPKSNWVAVEIRYERVFQIWYRMIFNNVQNLLILVILILWYLLSYKGRRCSCYFQ
jgi:tRNA (guanine-N7-)-methyltransferase